MKRNLKKLLVFMLIMFIMVISSTYFAEPQDKKTEETSGKIEMLADLNKNKLFDNLEEKLDKADINSKLPVIVVFDEEIGSNSIKKGLIKKVLGNTNPKHEYKIIPGMAVELTKGQINALSKLDFVKQIEYDMPVQATLDDATYWFGTQKAITDFGVTGDLDGNAASYSTSDVVIAVIDTGIDTTHVDLDGGKVVGWKDFVNNTTTPYDDNGHGTLCSSIAAGTGEGNSLYRGVAPGAALVAVKVLDSQGSGTISNVTAGIDWVAANKATCGIEILSLSLATSGSSNGTDATSMAINNAVDAGIVCFVSAGNDGPQNYTIGSPGAAEKAITVGAMTGVGFFNLAYYSGRGPTADNRIKPDITGPGIITAANANSTNGYGFLNGTSAATPFLAGTAALMLDANINMTPAQIKSTMGTTAIDFGPPGKDNDYGYGRLNGYSAIMSAGSFAEKKVILPPHMYTSGTINTVKKSDYYQFTLNNINFPIAITLIMPYWSSSTNPNFNLYLYNPSGTLVASSSTNTKQETIEFTPTVTGTYTIKVYSYAGTGSYFFDLTTGGSGLTLTGNDI